MPCRAGKQAEAGTRSRQWLHTSGPVEGDKDNLGENAGRDSDCRTGSFPLCQGLSELQQLVPAVMTKGSTCSPQPTQQKIKKIKKTRCLPVKLTTKYLLPLTTLH